MNMKEFDFKLYAQICEQVRYIEDEIHKRVGNKAAFVCVYPKEDHLRITWGFHGGADVNVSIPYNTDVTMEAIETAYAEQVAILREMQNDKY